jgi:hypothetical protein
MSVQELYQQSIRPLAVAQRLELASMILRDIPPQSLVDYQTEWSDEDLADFSRTTWSRLESDPEHAVDG